MTVIDLTGLPCGDGAARRQRILIVDDHDLIAQGLSFALRAEQLDVMLTRRAELDEVLAAVRVHRPVLALVDLQFSGDGFEGLPLIEPLTGAGVDVLVLTGCDHPAVLGSCLEAGAAGVVSKAEPFDVLLEGIRAALQGQPVNTARTREELLAAARLRRAECEARLAPFRALTAREGEVLHRLARGASAEAIAAQTFVSVATVRSHIAAVLRKLGVNSQLAAVALAHEAGWMLETS